MTGKDQAALWQQIVQDYETIRAEQEAVWQALDLSETAPVMDREKGEAIPLSRHLLMGITRSVEGGDVQGASSVFYG